MKILFEEKFKVRMRVRMNVGHPVRVESSEGENEVRVKLSEGENEGENASLLGGEI